MVNEWLRIYKNDQRFISQIWLIHKKNDVAEVAEMAEKREIYATYAIYASANFNVW